MVRKLLVFILALIISAAMADKGLAANKAAQVKTHTSVKDPASLYLDSSNIQAKHFDKNALQKFRKDPAFDYRDREGAGELSWFEKAWMWLMDVLFGWLRNAHLDGTWAGFFLTLLKYLLYAAALALVIFVIVKAIGIDVTNLFGRKSRKMEMEYSESIEDINAINFDDELEKALAQHNYRLAVRLLYLHSLKQLSDLQLIHWQIDKTNSAYVNELEDASQKQVFSVITRQFEYVWYGNFSIDKQAFVNISQLFKDFKQQLP
jgi:hypothetical protein